MGLFESRGSKDARQRVLDYKRTFGTPEGKRVLYDLINTYDVLNKHYADPLREGARGVVIDIILKCNISIEQFDQMLKGDSAE